MMHGFLNSAVASLRCLKWSPVGRDGSKGLVMDLGMFVTLATTNLLNSYQPPQGEVWLTAGPMLGSRNNVIPDSNAKNF